MRVRARFDRDAPHDARALMASAVADPARYAATVFNVGPDPVSDAVVYYRVLDPTKVVKTALTNSASIAGLLLTTEALVTSFDTKDQDKKAVVGSIR